MTRRRRLLASAVLVIALAAVGATPSTAGFVDAGSVYKRLGTVEAEDELFVGVDAGQEYSLGWDDRGDLFTWGRNDRGQLGHGTEGGTYLVPVRVQALDDHHVVHAAAGVNSAIALTDDGGVWTWGNPDYAGNTSVPQRVELFDTLADDVVGVDAGGHFYLAWTAAGALYSWGYAEAARLGRVPDAGPDPDHAGPARVTAQGLDTRVVTHASAGRFHGSAIAGGRVVAWGAGYGGVDGVEPAGLPASPSRPIGVAAGRDDTLVWTDDGILLRARSQDGFSVVLGLTAQFVVGAEVSAPEDPAAGPGLWAWTANRRLWAWGANDSGKLGLGSPSSEVPLPSAVVLAGGSVPRMIGAGGTHTLYDATDGLYAAAGDNTHGQLGDGTTTDRNWFGLVIPVLRWP